jgi:two-component system, NtrC family, sensor histidine kinase HydH
MTPSDQYAELAELAGGFIHEIKNHISTLSLNLQLLAEDFQSPQNHHERRALERVTRLQHECQRLVDISNDFLRFARFQELHREPTRLCDLVEEMIDFFAPTAKQAGIQIHWYPAPDLPTVNLDRELFKQALLNLMINAEQAMVEGGELILQARRDGSDVLLEVIDTGRGIPAEELPKIFKPFHTTKPGGTGLGLATTRKIVLAHGGTVEVQSAVGRGTKFTIRLPATAG